MVACLQRLQGDEDTLGASARTAQLVLGIPWALGGSKVVVFVKTSSPDEISDVC